MKLVANIKDRLSNSLTSLAIFYVIYAIISIAIPLILRIFSDNASSSFKNGLTSVVGTNITMAAFVYSVTIAIVMVTLRFNNSVQFGSSRKTIFVSYLVNSTVLSLCLVIMNLFFLVMTKGLLQGELNPSVISQFYKISDSSWEITSFYFVVYFLAFSIGTLSGLLLKRLKRIALYTLGAALVFVPMFLGYVFGILSPSAKLSVINFFVNILGLREQNIWAPILTILIISLILETISWLVIRRQPVK